MDKKMPIIKPGMVLELQPRRYDRDRVSTFMLVTYVTDSEVVGYTIDRDQSSVYAYPVLTQRSALTPEMDIISVYETGDGTFRPDQLLDIIDGDIDLKYLVYEGIPVREMTVEEIEKELGYKVKVIGNDL